MEADHAGPGLESKHVPLIIVSRSGDFIFASRSAEELFGYDQRRLAQQVATAVVFPRKFPACVFDSADPLQHIHLRLRRSDRRLMECKAVVAIHDTRAEIYFTSQRNVTRPSPLPPHKIGPARRDAESVTSISRSVVQVQEEERRRLSRELHDHFGQELVGLKLKLESISEVAERPWKAQLHDAGSSVDELIHQIRDIAGQLRPRLLDDLGLTAALAAHARIRCAQINLIPELFIEELGERLDYAVEITCFRVVQEALNNILKYAHATAVRVELRKKRDDIVLLVADNGCGFDFETATTRSEAGGLGLINIQERAALLGGRARIKSIPGRGTTVWCRIPLKAAAVENHHESHQSIAG